MQENGFTPLPVNPKELARRNEILSCHCRPRNQAFREHSCSNNIFPIGNSIAIGNTALRISPSRTSLVLEGHVEAILDNGAQYSKSGYMSNDVHEKKPDLFAFELLMPEFLMRPAIDGGGAGFAVIEKLAEEGQTSIVATSIRYAKLADDPVAVILSEGQKVQWCFISDCLRECQGLTWPAKHSDVPPASLTGRPSPFFTLGSVAARLSSFKKMWLDLVTTERLLTVVFTQEAFENDEVDEDGTDTCMHARDGRGATAIGIEVASGVPKERRFHAYLIEIFAARHLLIAESEGVARAP